MRDVDGRVQKLRVDVSWVPNLLSYLDTTPTGDAGVAFDDSVAPVSSPVSGTPASRPYSAPPSSAPPAAPPGPVE
jgi:hypothetical protein